MMNAQSHMEDKEGVKVKRRRLNPESPHFLRDATISVNKLLSRIEELSAAQVRICCFSHHDAFQSLLLK
jgi:hypothetical protein